MRGKEHFGDGMQKGCMEARMELLDGKELTCYARPKALQGNAQGDTGREEDKDFFLEHAFYFYRHAGRILADSRMFLCPVPVVSGLAYSGTTGFEAPTLGVYLEFWLHAGEQVTRDGHGNPALTYQISGSPLSGMNSCQCVYPDGKPKRIIHSSFKPVWKTFVQINRRYTRAKESYEAYSLQEVRDILAASDEQ